MYVALVEGIIRYGVENWLKADGIEDCAFVDNPEPMSPRGVFDPMLDWFKAKLQSGLLRGINTAERLAKKGMENLNAAENRILIRTGRTMLNCNRATGPRGHIEAPA